MLEEELWERSERAFQAYGEPLDNVTAFKYMGRVLTAGENNCKTVAGKLLKLRKSWVLM